MAIQSASLLASLNTVKAQSAQKRPLNNVFQNIIAKADDVFDAIAVKKYSIPQTIAGKQTSKVDVGIRLDSSKMAYEGEYDLSTNNMADGNVSPHYSRTVSIHDSLGVAHDVGVSFLKTAENKWRVEIHNLSAGETVNGKNLLAAGEMNFNSDGSLNSVDSSLTQIAPITWSNGAVTNNLSFNFGTAGTEGVGTISGMSQFPGSPNAKYMITDGSSGGTLTEVKHNRGGGVTAYYSDGQSVVYEKQKGNNGNHFANVDLNQIQNTVSDALRQLQALKAYKA